MNLTENTIIPQPFSTHPRFVDLTNHTYGFLQVLAFAGIEKHKSKWFCKCRCGVITIQQTNHLRNGSIVSCGCYRLERVRAVTCKHGLKNHPLYTVWKGIRNRCNNKNTRAYPNYGGRGITVCARWNDFSLFLADMGERPNPSYTLERVDNDLGYSPENCIWATRHQQSHNKRNSLRVTFQNKTQTIAEWATELGINYWTLFSRIKRNWRIEDALTIPVKSVAKYT